MFQFALLCRFGRCNGGRMHVAQPRFQMSGRRSIPELEVVAFLLPARQRPAADTQSLSKLFRVHNNIICVGLSLHAGKTIKLPQFVPTFCGPQTWCDEKRGRRSEIARLLGIGRQSVTDWFSGRQQPTAEQILFVQEFLVKRRKKRKA